MAKIFFIIWACLLITPSLPAQEPVTDSLKKKVETDNSAITLRQFDAERIDEFRNNPDYRYRAMKREGTTWWDRIWFAILQFIGRLLSLATGTVLGRILFYGFCAGLIIYFIIRFFNIDIKDAFYQSSKAKKSQTAAAEENIHEISFEDRIKEAYNQRDFRECVRLTFLYALKKLSDSDAIKWKPGKTNDEYWRELSQHPARQPWQELRLYFDYAWYGHFDIDENTYGEIQNVFTEFNRKLQ